MDGQHQVVHAKPKRKRLAPPVVHPASPEQAAIVDAIGHTHVVVEAVAGSGKSSTATLISMRYPQKNILLMTYNSKLRTEFKDRVTRLKLKNMTVHTFHSFGYAYVGPECATDQGIISFIRDNADWCKTPPKYDIIILDECQDLSPALFNLAVRIIRDNQQAKVATFGDPFQAVYQFSGADPKYLTKAPELFGPYIQGEWTRLTLSTSYRMTAQMSEFVNFCIPGRNIRSVRQGPKVVYREITHERSPADDIKHLIFDRGFKAEDIFVIAATVKGQKDYDPVKRCANSLSRLKIPVYIPNDDDAKITKEALRHKVLFSSMHQAKGMERKIAMIISFDRSYYEFHGRDLDENVCANALYVAITRGSEELYVYANSSKEPLPFVRGRILPDIPNQPPAPLCLPTTADVYVTERHRTQLAEPLSERRLKPLPTSYTVTKLTHHIPSVVIEACIKKVTITRLRDPDDMIELSGLSEQGRLIEVVNMINGVASCAWWQHTIMGTTEINKHQPINRIPANILECATRYVESSEGVIFRSNQIKEYNWISLAQFEHICARLMDELPGQPRTEVKIARSGAIGSTIYTISGRIDAIINNRVIEIKTASALNEEMVLQLCLYSWIMHKQQATLPHSQNCTFHLFNVLTNELIQIEATSENLDWIVRMLMCKKLHVDTPIADDEFIRNAGVLPAAEPCAVCKNMRFAQ